MSGTARIIGGAALGVVITVVTVAGVSAVRRSTPAGASEAGILADGARLLSGTEALALGCQPDQSAVVHRVTIQEQPVQSVRCVTLAPAVPPEPRTWQAAAGAPTARPLAARPVASAAPARVVQSTGPAATREAPEAASGPAGRSWQETAMVIGGSTATGAGVGGLVGGKKGALIGAAIGGGASTIYESARR